MTNEPLITSYDLDGDILVIKLHGNLDSTSTPEFNQEIAQHFEAGRHKIIIDCAHLGFISSVGIGALVALQSRLRREGGEVKLAAIQSVVMDVLRMVHLDRLLDIYGDIQFARESFAESS